MHDFNLVHSFRSRCRFFSGRLTRGMIVFIATITQPAWAEDLIAVYQTAVENDPVIGAATASFQADQERVPQARALLLPSITARLTTTKNEQTYPGAADAFPDQYYNNHSWSAQLRQPVINLSSWFTLGSARSSVRASEHRLEAQRQDLIVRVLEAYLNILRTRDRLDTTNSEVIAVGRQLEQVQQRFDVGLVAITDVLEAQAAYDSAVVRQIQAESDHDISFETLSTLTGRSYDNLARLSDDLPIVDPNPREEEAWVTSALQSNSGVQAAMDQLESARKNRRSRIATRVPTVEAVITHSDNTTGGINFFGVDNTETTLYALEVSVPLIQGGAIRSQVKESSARIEEARQQLLNQQLTVTRNTRSLFKSVVTDVARVQARLKAIKSSQSALEATQTGYEVGTRNIVDVLQAQQRLYGSQFDYADSRYNYLLNLIRLKQTSGGLSETDLAELNQFTDPTNPVERVVSLRNSLSQ